MFLSNTVVILFGVIIKYNKSSILQFESVDIYVITAFTLLRWVACVRMNKCWHFESTFTFALWGYSDTLLFVFEQVELKPAGNSYGLRSYADCKQRHIKELSYAMTPLGSPLCTSCSSSVNSSWTHHADLRALLSSSLAHRCQQVAAMETTMPTDRWRRWQWHTLVHLAMHF